MGEAPKKPSRLALWIAENRNPDTLRVEYRQTGTDTAETVIVLKSANKSTECGPGDIGDSRYSYEHDVYLSIGYASIVELTNKGRERVDAWNTFAEKEAADLAEFDRLKKKFEEKK